MNHYSAPSTVSNIPIGCTFCGAIVQGRASKKIVNPRTKQTINECRWVCPRCNQLVKVGQLPD